MKFDVNAPVFSPIKFWKEHGQKADSPRTLRSATFVVPEFTSEYPKEKQMVAGVTDVMVLPWNLVLGLLHPPIPNFVNCGVCGRKLPQTTFAQRTTNKSFNLFSIYTLPVLIGTLYHTTDCDSNQDAKDYSHAEPPRKKLSSAQS